MRNLLINNIQNPNVQMNNMLCLLYLITGIIRSEVDSSIDIALLYLETTVLPNYIINTVQSAAP